MEFVPQKRWKDGKVKVKGDSVSLGQLVSFREAKSTVSIWNEGKRCILKY